MNEIWPTLLIAYCSDCHLFCDITDTRSRHPLSVRCYKIYCKQITFKIKIFWGQGFRRTWACCIRSHRSPCTFVKYCISKLRPAYKYNIDIIVLCIWMRWNKVQLWLTMWPLEYVKVLGSFFQTKLTQKRWKLCCIKWQKICLIDHENIRQ